MPEAVAEALRFQSRACASLGADFSGEMLDRAAADAQAGGIAARLLSPWADVPVDQAVRGAVALRLLASLHYLVLSGLAPDLAAAYPPRARDPARAWGAAQAALEAHPDVVARLLAHEPQTNEVRRSACLLGGFLRIASATGLPLRSFEIGASAGLNSLWSSFRYEIGDRAWGDARSPVILPARWEGAAPSLDTSLSVVSRRACDRRPVDLTRPDEATRLLAYCWAEQAGRMARLRAAIGLARAVGFEVEAQPASTWLGVAAPQAGAATVVFHSIVWQYMPPAERAAVMRVMAAHAACATREAPLAWLRMEPDDAGRTFELRLSIWPGGDDLLLADVHPHGEFAVWR
jgi:hypothetical protein